MRLPTLLLAALSLAAAGPVADPPPELLLAREGGITVLARPTGSGLRVEAGGEEPLELALPSSSRAAGLLSLRSGWLLYGVQELAGGSELLLLERRGAHERHLPSPGDRTAARREGPMAVAASGRLHSLIWLEGEHRGALAVRAARWKGNRWSAPVTVSPLGPGSQLALSVAVLTDGELLLVWSAFDGGDDEILWSRTRGGLWTPPAAVAPDNAVPDITPALASLPGGALAAWSRFGEAGYTLLTASFDGDRWTAPVALEGAGGLFPVFERPDGELLLLSRRARPAGWEVLHLDARGRAFARAAVNAAGQERPVIAGTSEAGVRLLWTDHTALATWAPALVQR